MRDIVATIQPDQDDIVRADADATVCVQGAPGTGKTAVGLHRVAYLLYAHANRMKRGGVLVIGPNRAFLSYIGNVLPALGEVGVSQVTIADLVATVEVRATDTERAARIKGDARMAEVLRRALWAGLSEPAGGLMLSRGSRRWRVPADEIAGLARELRDRGVRYGPGRDMLGHRIAHVVLTRMEAAGETCDDRTHESVRRTREVRAVVDEVWPAADPVRLVLRLLAEPELLARAADGLLDPAEQAEISWPVAPRGPRSARWSAADAVLVDEARDLIERIPSLSHVVVDEAQDLSAMECRAVGRRCATGSATVLGDLAQATTPAAVADWAALLGHLGKPDAGLRLLETGYRVPRQILDYASLLLPRIAPGVPPARSFRQDPGALAVTGTTPGSLPRRARPGLRRRPGPAWVRRGDRRGRPGERAGPGAGPGRDDAPCPWQRGPGRPAHPGARQPGQGPGVRPRDRGRACRHRRRALLRAAPVVRGAHPRGVPADRAALPAAARAAGLRPDGRGRSHRYRRCGIARNNRPWHGAMPAILTARCHAHRGWNGPPGPGRLPPAVTGALHLRRNRQSGSRVPNGATSPRCVLFRRSITPR